MSICRVLAEFLGSNDNVNIVYTYDFMVGGSFGS